MENYKDDFALKRARARVKEIKGFYFNLLCYCIVIPTLVIINLVYTPDFYWFFFSMFGWGIGLVFHGMAAFRYMPFLKPDWEERKIREFMEEDRRRSGTFTNQDN
jgi:hypothetical protein